ncbi:hypothetical protein [Achromobacter spanius]|uniref:hypothetical protein n=1 Tax=Achromobacter spanius TaxID=217203 RepID=UPI003A91E125
MGDAVPRTTKFLAELHGDLETVSDICSKCPEGISLEENFAGWKPNPKALIKAVLVAHQDMEAHTAALLVALAVEDTLGRPARGCTSLRMRVTVGSNVELSRIKEHFRPIADCQWAEIEITRALEPVIPVKTINMSDLIKQAIAQSREADS